jgi:hypothetical protein
MANRTRKRPGIRRMQGSPKDSQLRTTCIRSVSCIVITAPQPSDGSLRGTGRRQASGLPACRRRGGPKQHGDL